jgi:hypothetical protein
MFCGYVVAPTHNPNRDVLSHVHAEVSSSDVIRFNSNLDRVARPSNFHFCSTPWPCPFRPRSLHQAHSGENPTGRTHHSP